MAQRNLEELNKISGIILQCALEVHKQLGPGLLESVYEVCLVKELIAKGQAIRILGESDFRRLIGMFA